MAGQMENVVAEGLTDRLTSFCFACLSIGYLLRSSYRKFEHTSLFGNVLAQCMACLMHN